MVPTPDDFEVKRLQLDYGLISVPDVISWADGIIAESDVPENAIIDLALSGKKTPDDIVFQLAKLAIGCDRYRAMRFVLGQMHLALQKNRTLGRGFAHKLLQFAVDNFHREFPENLMFIYCIDDEYDLAEQGLHGSIDSVTDKFIENLNIFDVE
jgi:hypothetical protein